MAKYPEHVMLAITESLGKWEKNLKTAENIKPIRQDPNYHLSLGFSECPLCAIFHPLYKGSQNFNKDFSVKGCTGCPVRDFSGSDFCENTPYEEIEGLTEDFIDDEDWPLSFNYDKLIELVQKELDFVRKLKEWADE